MIKNKRIAILVLSLSFGLLLTILKGAEGLTLKQVAGSGAIQIDLSGPPGSERFGEEIVVLSNGNIVVTDPYYDEGNIEDVGAVYLFDGASGTLISKLMGSSANDQVGLDGVTKLTNGHYVIVSSYWNNSAGAVTWANSTTGISGTVNAQNSIVGSNNFDQVGRNGVTALTNGNYVIASSIWPVDDRLGAVTWGNGMTGITGTVSPENSLVGEHGDAIGLGGIITLTNGNYVVYSPNWDRDRPYTGAVTWGNGQTGTTGVVNAENSLVGSSWGDRIGKNGIIPLSNGNYVVVSIEWDNGDIYDAGAVTWGNGETGTSGAVSPGNSLVGGKPQDRVGSVQALANGNYVVRSGSWDYGGVADAGAVTWVNGTIGRSGYINYGNSLVGNHTNNVLGAQRITELTNGNFVLVDPKWNNGSAGEAGAVIWVNGETGITGFITYENSLTGSQADDHVGTDQVTALTNGNYVVRSPGWDNGDIVNAGAVTLGDGVQGTIGVVDLTNSLVGTSTNDRIGNISPVALANGNFVVGSTGWDNNGIGNVGAVTWGNGTKGITGPVSITNSLVGSQTDDEVGNSFILALSNGHYAVGSPDWDNGEIVNAGAVTWGDGTKGITGSVSTTNSLVGSHNRDFVGLSGTPLVNGNYVVAATIRDDETQTRVGALTWARGSEPTADIAGRLNSLIGDQDMGNVRPLDNGNYIVFSPSWPDNSGRGAVTLGDGHAGQTTGVISPDYSVLGVADGGGEGMNFDYDYANDQLVVGRPADNTVTLLRINLPPVVDTGGDQQVPSLALVTLDGSGTTEPYGYLPITFNWSQTAGPAVTLSNSTGISPTFTAPGVTETISFTFSLVVTDSLGLASAPEQVVVTVEPYRIHVPTLFKP